MFTGRPILAALFALSAASLACAPEKVDMNVHDVFTADAALYALQSSLPASTLAAVGGSIPNGTWPASAQPLLLDLPLVAENKIDFTAAGIDTSAYSGIRMHFAQLTVAAPAGVPLSPTPTWVELFIGPASATAITDPGVAPLASGAYPLQLSADSTDGGCGSDPAAGVCAPDAGGAAASAPAQSLVFAADAQLDLQTRVFAATPFAIFVVLHLPIDSALDASLPAGEADLSFDVQFEMAR